MIREPTSDVATMPHTTSAGSAVPDLHHAVPGNAASNAAMSVFLQRLLAQPVSGKMDQAWWRQAKKIPADNKYGLAHSGWELFQDIASKKPALLQKLDPDAKIRMTLHADETLPQLQTATHHHNDHAALAGFGMIPSSPGVSHS